MSDAATTTTKASQSMVIGLPPSSSWAARTVPAGAGGTCGGAPGVSQGLRIPGARS